MGKKAKVVLSPPDHFFCPCTTGTLEVINIENTVLSTPLCCLPAIHSARIAGYVCTKCLIYMYC